MLRRALLILAAVLIPGPVFAVTIERVVSPGGVEAWLVEDHSNPVIALEATFRAAGSASDPGVLPGLAYMTAGLLDEGAGPYDSKTFQAKLENEAIGLTFDAGRDHFRVSLNTLADRQDDAFELLRLSLSQPRFDGEPVRRVRGEILSMLAQEKQSPDTVAARAWFAHVFAGHPYARPVRGTPDSVKAIRTSDLRAWVKTRLGRSNLVVGVVGDITPEDLGHRLDQVFAALPAEGPKDEVSEWTAAPPGGVEVLNRPIPQSVATFGELGLKRNDPDWYVATVMDNILGGGGFSSRLTAEVREKRGLAYSVYTALAPMDHGAVILGGVATRNERLGDSLRLIKDEWRRMRDEGPTDAELADAKTYLVGSFALRLDSSPSVAGLLVAIQLDHLGIDYLDRRADLIGGVTADDVRRVAKRLLDPDALIVTVVGQPEGLADDQSPRGGASQ